MDFDTYNELNSGDKRAILESIFADNTDLLFNEDRGEDYDYAQDIIDASYLHFGHLRPDIQNEILSGGYDSVITESKASEGGFGRGKRGHSSWMKDIEFGGNYKKCPLCNINTNFSGGKCEICGNSFAGEKKKANEMSDDEWMNKIEQLANKTGVKTIAVQNFLISVGNNGSVGNALANLESDTRMYKWNARTVNAIQKGIMIYFDKVKNDSSQTFEDKYPNTLW